MNQTELEKAIKPWIVPETKGKRLEGASAFSYEVMLHDEWRCKLTLGIREECLLIVIAYPDVIQEKVIPTLLAAINRLNLDMAEGCIELVEASQKLQYRSCLVKTCMDLEWKELRHCLAKACEQAYVCFSHLEAVMKNTEYQR